MKRTLLACGIALAVFASPASAQAPPPIKLTLTPAKPPTPALRYQLLPDAQITVSGDAAPLYKEAIELRKKQLFDRQAELFDAWSQLPLDELPKDAVRKELAKYNDVFSLLDKASRCDRCDWGLLERLRAQGIATLLPEFQDMRQCALLLSLRARLEIAEGRFDQAVVTLRNGFALARHTGDTETLISYLVGLGAAGMVAGQLDQFVAASDAPNLYYALTDLPAPLISMRKGMQGERVSIYSSFPGLAGVASDLDAGNLSEQQLADCMKMLDNFNQMPASNYLVRVLLARKIQNQHEIAKKALIVAGRPREKVVAMPHIQVALLHALLEYDVALDERIVLQYLPYWEAMDRLQDLDKRTRNARANPAADAAAIPLAALGAPSIKNIVFNRARAERKIALLRAIEAIRFYAATHDGKLPPALGAVKEVPIPLDPVTGKDFEYQLDGDVARLRGPAPDAEKPDARNSVTYQLRIRR